MRELVERFSYRFQLWQKERYGDRWGADPTVPRNPLRIVAFVTTILLIFNVTEPFVFHRGLDPLAIVGIPIAVLFLILYYSKSRWAWHVCVAWVPIAFFVYWILRFIGYSRYQTRVHSPPFDFAFAAFDVALSTAVLIWLFRIRERYLRHIHDDSSQQT